MSEFNCTNCEFSQYPHDDEHCYMFKDPPDPPTGEACLAHSSRPRPKKINLALLMATVITGGTDWLDEG